LNVAHGVSLMQTVAYISESLLVNSTE